MDSDIQFSDFQKVDIRIGRVLEVKEVEGADKLLRCVVDFGELGKRVVFSGIKKWYKPSDLEGKLLPYVVNLEPREMFGEKSEAMLLAASSQKDGEKEAVLIKLDKDVLPGTKVV